MSMPFETAGLSRSTRMRLALVAAGMSVGDMAERMMKDRNTTSGWLSGRHEPDGPALISWAHITNVDVDWLVGDEPVGRPKAVGRPRRQPAAETTEPTVATSSDNRSYRYNRVAA